MNKDEMISKVKAEVETQEKNLENLKSKAAKASSDLSSEFQKTIDELEPRINQAKEKLAEIVDSADDQWDDLMDSLESGWNEISNSFESRFDNLADTFKNIFSTGSKEEFLKNAQDSIDVQQEKLLALKQKIEEGSDKLADNLKEEYQNAVDVLDTKIEEAKGSFSEISGVADHRWDYMKSSSEKGWNEFKSKFDEGFDDLADSVKKLFS